ncbi:uncharacterized protein LOC130409434 [Triplophysa dalaica]|uniref:uncharacterized protein LOC130409434 n=1 Tax=Triplophysa dalaica TaxID=1582913 RepID=UPI0024E0159F|nr:uncharacterized protein LOC130409434 [Triplophysa dalaica]
MLRPGREQPKRTHAHLVTSCSSKNDPVGVGASGKTDILLIITHCHQTQRFSPASRWRRRFTCRTAAREEKTGYSFSRGLMVSMMMVQVDVMCCKSVGTDLSMLDIDDLMTEICQLKKEVKLLETKLRERDQLNRKDVCGVSLCDFTDQTSPDLLLSVCNEEQKTSVKLLDCEMKLKTEITEAVVQTEKGVLIYSDLMESKTENTESGNKQKRLI